MKFKDLILAGAGVLALVGPAFQAEAQQQGKPNVYIDYFWRPSNVNFNYAETLRNNVMEVINETDRVELIDVDSQSALKVEKERRESGDLGTGEELDLDRIAVMKEEGANALIQGRITSLNIVRNTPKSGNVYYDGTINYTLKAIDPNTGKIIATKTITAGDDMLNFQTADTPEGAAMNLCKAARRGVRSFIEEAFPINATILEVAESKGNDIKSVYISVGSANGAKEKNKFTINVEREIAGRLSTKMIGELEIKEVQGDDISLAEVKKGGKELKEAMDNGQTITLKSKVRKENIKVNIF